MDVFANAKWIWYEEKPKPDSYGDFFDSFNYTEGKVNCNISCDGDYTLFVNGVYVSSNQYSDFEHYKIYDTIDITEYLVQGDNKIYILVWHLGVPTSRYKPGKAGLLYSIECDGKAMAQSSQETLSSQNPNYKSNYCKLITYQIGQSFLYDSSILDKPSRKKSVLVDKRCEMYPRPIKKLELLEEKAITFLKKEGTHFLIDLGEETVGLPVLRFHSETEQKITVSWGEHIADGGVRRKIKDRDFSYEYIAKTGENNYTNYMLRLGGRYLEVFSEAPIEVDYIGIIPQIYPVREVPKTFDDNLDQKIYDVCVKTLKLCMMEHYVDTPWREQSFYSLDSRHQIICGYKAFAGGNKEYVRANLLLISKDVRDDGLLSITYPSGGELAIPSFSLHYFTAIKEYIENTGDCSLGLEVYDKLLSLVDVFKKQLKNGILCSFFNKEHWNFYDWSPFLVEKIGVEGSKQDYMLSCLFLIALQNMKYIAEKISKPFNEQALIDELRCNIKEMFFNKESGLFSLSSVDKEFNQLPNALAILAGITTQSEAEIIAQKLMSDEVAECSLSAKTFIYDALLKVDKEYLKDVLKEIRKNYTVMLEAGATSVWEVIEGESAFEDAGSLCHGWSAIPILYLE